MKKEKSGRIKSVLRMVCVFMPLLGFAAMALVRRGFIAFLERELGGEYFSALGWFENSELSGAVLARFDKLASVALILSCVTALILLSLKMRGSARFAVFAKLLAVFYFAFFALLFFLWFRALYAPLYPLLLIMAGVPLAFFPCLYTPAINKAE